MPTERQGVIAENPDQTLFVSGNAEASPHEAEAVAEKDSQERLEKNRSEYLDYRRLQTEQSFGQARIAEIAPRLEKLAAFLNRPGASAQAMRSIHEKLSAELAVLQGRQAEVATELARPRSPDFEEFLETVDRLKEQSGNNVRELREHIDANWEALSTKDRLELMGTLYGLQPSESNKTVLAGLIREAVKQHSIDNYSHASKALFKALEYSEKPLDIEGLIQLIQPPAEFLKTSSSRDYKQTVESLYAHSRSEAYHALAEKRVQYAIEQGNPDTAKAVLASEDLKLGDAKNSAWVHGIARHQQQILQLYLRQGNGEAARAYLEDKNFGGEDRDGEEKLFGRLAVYRTTRSPEDLRIARETVVYSSLYEQEHKWRSIGAVSEDPQDFEKANKVLEEMARTEGYAVRSFFDTCARVYEQPGADRQCIEQLLRRKIEQLSEFDRVFAYMSLAAMTKKPEDEQAVKTAMVPLVSRDRLFEKGIKSEMLSGQEQVRSSAAAYGYLLYYFSKHAALRPNGFSPENERVARGILERFRSVSAPEDSQDYTWNGSKSAEFFVNAAFLDPEHLARYVSEKNIQDVIHFAHTVANKFRLIAPAARRQKIFEIIEDAVVSKLHTDEEKTAVLSRINFWLSGDFEKEERCKILERAQKKYTTATVRPLYEGTADHMHSVLAECTVTTEQSDRHIASISDVSQKGQALGRVAKLRRDYAFAAA